MHICIAIVNNSRCLMSLFMDEEPDVDANGSDVRVMIFIFIKCSELRFFIFIILFNFTF